jgi:hypothetical protein
MKYIYYQRVYSHYAVSPTDHTYIVQKSTDFGMMSFIAGRFLPSDSVIPNPADSQSYNHYLYKENTPVEFNDPNHENDLFLLN